MKRFWILSLLAIFNACHKPQTEQELVCATVLCMTANPKFLFKFLDKTTNADLIATNVIDTSLVKVWNQYNDTLPNEAITVTVDSLKSSYIISDWPKNNNSNNKLFIRINEGTVIEVDYFYKFIRSGCCGTGYTQNIKVPGYSFTEYPFNSNTVFKIVKIKI